MGTWGTGIYQNDTAEDALDDFKAVFSVKDPEEGTKILIKEYVDISNLTLFTDDCIDFWLALADWQWEKGILLDSVKQQALKIIDSGAGLESWIEESNAKDIENRKQVLENLRVRLNSAMPEKKIIKYCTHTSYKIGDIVAIKPNNKIVYSTKYETLPYFPNVKKALERCYNGRGIDLQFSDDYAPIINPDSYFLMICVKIERSYCNKLVPELYDEYPYFTFLDYYSPTLEGIESKASTLKFFKIYDTEKESFTLDTTRYISQLGFSKSKKITNCQKLIEEFTMVENQADLNGDAKLKSFLETYEILNNDKIKYSLTEC